MLIKELKNKGFNFDKLPKDIKSSIDLIENQTSGTMVSDNQRLEVLDNTTFDAIEALFPDDKDVRAVALNRALEYSEIVNDGFNTVLEEETEDSFSEGGAIQVMDEETYLDINGASRQGFGDSALHKNRGGASDKAWTKIIDAQAEKDKKLMARREELRKEYAEKVAKGEIRPMSRFEKLIETAQGNPENEAVQAARRILAKNNVRWDASEKMAHGGMVADTAQYKSYSDFVKDNIGEDKFVITVGSGGGNQPFGGATKESIDAQFKDLIFHNFSDSNFLNNYCPDELTDEYKGFVGAYYENLISDSKEFAKFWKKYMRKSGHYDSKFQIQNPNYDERGKALYGTGNTIEHYPDVIFKEYDDLLSDKLKAEYSKYRMEYAGVKMADGGKVLSNIRDEDKRYSSYYGHTIMNVRNGKTYVNKIKDHPDGTPAKREDYEEFNNFTEAKDYIDNTLIRSSAGVKMADGGAVEYDKRETKEEYFGLSPAKTIGDVTKNIDEILFQYSGRKMAALQVGEYLYELGSLGKDWIIEKGISTQEHLNKYCSQRQSHVRTGKGKERQESIKQFRQEQADRVVADITSFAERAEDDMQRQIAERDVQFADGGATEQGVQFSEYKGETIMFEPIYKKWYSNDEEFNSEKEVKDYIDNGSVLSANTINAYRKGAMKEGGKVSPLTRDKVAEMLLYINENGAHKLVSKYKGLVSDDDIDSIIGAWATSISSLEEILDDYWTRHQKIEDMLNRRNNPSDAEIDAIAKEAISKYPSTLENLVDKTEVADTVTRTPNQYEVFELTKDLNTNIKKGSYGVILEVYNDNAFEVEFVKDDGSNIEFEGHGTFTVDRSFIKTTSLEDYNKRNKFKEGGLIAPNGKSSNLTPEQYNIVRGTEFKKWFGDWEKSPETASKVVDENGEPRVMWHGSPNMDKITIFKSNKGYGHSWFSDNKGEDSGAMYYARNEEGKYTGSIKPFFINARKIFDIYKYIDNEDVTRVIVENADEYKNLFYNFSTLFDREKRGSEDMFKFEGYPLDVDDATVIKYLMKNYTDSFLVTETKSFQDFIKSKGYDSFLSNESGGDFGDIAVYNPANIKLADGTNTTFDENNPDIRFKQGGSIGCSCQHHDEYAGGGEIERWIPYSDEDMREYTLRVKKEIEGAGYYVSNPSYSKTDFGNSNYISVFRTENDWLEGYEGAKVRISDHSVTNRDRMANEIHLHYPIREQLLGISYAIKEVDFKLNRNKYFEKKDILENNYAYMEVPEHLLLPTDEVKGERLSTPKRGAGRKIYNIVRTSKRPATEWVYIRDKQNSTNVMANGGAVDCPCHHHDQYAEGGLIGLKAKSTLKDRTFEVDSFEVSKPEGGEVNVAVNVKYLYGKEQGYNQGWHKLTFNSDGNVSALISVVIGKVKNGGGNEYPDTSETVQDILESLNYNYDYPRDFSTSLIELVNKVAKEHLGEKVVEEEQLTGGYADAMNLGDIAEMHGVELELLMRQAKIGYKVEREHTDDPAKIKEIIKDHLYENPYYYTMLKDMESSYDKIKEDEYEHWLLVGGSLYSDLRKFMIEKNIKNLEMPTDNPDLKKIAVATADDLDLIFVWLHKVKHVEPNEVKTTIDAVVEPTVSEEVITPSPSVAVTVKEKIVEMSAEEAEEKFAKYQNYLHHMNRLIVKNYNSVHI